jgi:hypothetical protein
MLSTIRSSAIYAADHRPTFQLAHFLLRVTSVPLRGCRSGDCAKAGLACAEKAVEPEVNHLIHE